MCAEQLLGNWKTWVPSINVHTAAHPIFLTKQHRHSGTYSTAVHRLDSYRRPISRDNTQKICRKCDIWAVLGFNPSNAELNPICHLLALLRAHHIFHVSGLRVNAPQYGRSVRTFRFLEYGTETSARKGRHTVRRIPKEGTTQLQRGGSLRPRVVVNMFKQGMLRAYVKIWCVRVIIIIIIIIIISFMQGIYTHIPETNCVPREYSVAAILLLLFMVLISFVSVFNQLYLYISTFRSMCLLLLLLLLLLLTAIQLSLGGSSPYTSTDTTNKNRYT